MIKKALLYFLLGIGLNSFCQTEIIHEIKIKGNKKLKSSFLLSLVSPSIGNELDSLKMEKDIKWFKQMPSISHAYYQVFPSDNENHYIIIYHIEENFTLIPSANIYTTDNDEFAYRLGLHEFNLFGRNIAFGGFYQKDIYNSYAINFRAPFLFSKNLGLSVNYKDLSTLEPVFLDDTTANYKYSNESIEVLGLFRLNFNNRFEAGINYFVEDYVYKSGATNPSVPLELNVHKWMVKGMYEYNNLNYDYQYVDGFRSIFNFQYVTSTNHMLPDFVIGWNDFLYYKRLGDKGNWANRLRLGLATNDETPFAPFSVDNNVNIRGVGNTIDRGTGAIVLNTEYRHTLIEKNWFVLQGNVFLDAGTWRNPGGELKDFQESENIKIYSGLGLRFMHRRIYNAIFRIDYGYGITENETKGFVFGIGQYF